LEKKSEVVEKGLTLRVLVIGLVIVAITTAYFNFMLRSGAGGVPWGPEIALALLRHKVPGINTDHTILRNSSSWPITIGFFMTINILGAYIMKLTKGKKLISLELIVLSTMIATSFYYFFMNGPNCEWGRDANAWFGVGTGLSLYESGASPEEWALLPPLVAPNDPAVYDAVVPKFYGWTIHPAFYPSLLWSILFFGSMTFTFVFWSMILKILWFDIESIPSPWVEIQTQSLLLVAGASEEGTGGAQRSGRLRWFGIGFLVSLIYTILAYGYTVVQDALDPTKLISHAYNGYLWGTEIQIAPMIDVTMLGILPWVPLFLSFLPYQIGFAIILPLDIIYSVVLGYLIFDMIIPIAFTSAGILPPYEPGNYMRGVTGRIFDDSWVDRTGANSWAVGLYEFTIIGLLFGLTIYPFIRYRERIRPLIRALYGKTDESLEALSPIPIRYVWIGLIISLIIWFSCWAAIGAYMPVVGATLLIQSIMITGAVRAGMYTAGVNFMNDFTTDCWYPEFWKLPGQALAYNFHPPPNTNVHMAWATFQATFRDQAIQGWVTNQSQNLAYSLYSLRLGDNFKISRRDMGIAIMLSFATIIVFAVPFYILRYHVWPWGPNGVAYAGDDWAYKASFKKPLSRFTAGRWWNVPSIVSEVLPALGNQAIAQIIGYGALGFALVPLLYYLRGRISWFRILPEGIFLGILIGKSYIIGPLILALVIKWIIFKAGLTDAYRNKIYPLCMGLVLGYFIPFAMLFMVVAFYSTPASMFWKLSQIQV